MIDPDRVTNMLYSLIIVLAVSWLISYVAGVMSIFQGFLLIGGLLTGFIGIYGSAYDAGLQEGYKRGVQACHFWDLEKGNIETV